MTQSLSKNNSLSSAECSVHSPPSVSDNILVTRGSRGLRAGNQFDDIICNLHGHITSVTTTAVLYTTLHHIHYYLIDYMCDKKAIMAIIRNMFGYLYILQQTPHPSQ